MGEPIELDEDVYEHLRALAHRVHAKHGFGHMTLQPTVLLHEAWMKLENSSARYASRAHFMATAARAMRQILVDKARAAATAKRGGDRQRVTLSGVSGGSDETLDAMVVDQLLDELERINPRAAQVALLRTFGGMTHADIATVLEVTTRTVERDWRFASAFLADQFSERER